MKKWSIVAMAAQRSSLPGIEPRVTLHRSLAFSNGRTTFSPACLAATIGVNAEGSPIQNPI